MAALGLGLAAALHKGLCPDGGPMHDGCMCGEPYQDSQERPSRALRDGDCHRHSHRLCPGLQMHPVLTIRSLRQGGEQPCGSNCKTSSVFLQSSGLSHQKNPCKPSAGSRRSPRWHLLSQDRANPDAANTLKPPEALRRAAWGVASLSQPHQLPGTGRVWGWGVSPSVLVSGPGAGPWQGLGSWPRSPTALCEATKHLQILDSGGEGTVFVSCGRQHLSSLSEVATTTVGGRKLCFSLATVPFLAGQKCLGTASL